jgi:hypothetical protein
MARTLIEKSGFFSWFFSDVNVGLGLGDVVGGLRGGGGI